MIKQVISNYLEADHVGARGQFAFVDNNTSSCKLDVHTRLRMSEAENAVLQQQISL